MASSALAVDHPSSALPPPWIIISLVAAFGVTLALDVPSRSWVTESVRDYEHNSKVLHCIKLVGDWQPLVVAALGLFFFHRLRWRAALALVAASVASQLAGGVLKWAVGRWRPVLHNRAPFELTPFRDGLPGVFHQSNLSFPSGHAVAAWTLATVLMLLVPRYWPLWLAAAIACSMERVVAMAHWPSDVVGAAAVGIPFGYLAVWLAEKRLASASKRSEPHGDSSVPAVES